LLDELLGGFAIDLHAYAIMSNHIHMVLRPRPDVAEAWAAERVARLGLKHIPLRVGVGITTVPVTSELTDRYANNDRWVREHRQRLSSITWFMKLFKQRIARRANAEEGCTGHFWESRFQTVPLLDPGAVIACMAYVDLNPIRAGMVASLDDAVYTSIAHRLLRAGQSDARVQFDEADLDLGRRLTPLSRCHPVDQYTGEVPASGLRLEDYLRLIEPALTGRAEDRRVFDRLGLDPDLWADRAGHGGLFQGVAVGGGEARRAFARTQGKNTLADKTKIWFKR